MIRELDLGPESINGNGQIINVEAEIAARVDIDPNIDSAIARGNVEESDSSTSDNLSCCWSSPGSFAYRNEYCSLGTNGARIELQDPVPVLISPVPTPGSNYPGRCVLQFVNGGSSNGEFSIWKRGANGERYSGSVDGIFSDFREFIIYLLREVDVILCPRVGV